MTTHRAAFALTAALAIAPNLAAHPTLTAAVLAAPTVGEYTTAEGFRYRVLADVPNPTGLLVHLHGDGGYEYENPYSEYMLGGPEGITAAAAARGLVPVAVLTPDTSSMTWWEDGANNTAKLVPLIRQLQADYSVQRVIMTGYSGGADVITNQVIPQGDIVRAGNGVILMSGGGVWDRPDLDAGNPDRGSFWMHYEIGKRDTPDSPDGYNTVEWATQAEAAYRAAGYPTTFTLTDEGHDLGGNGRFGGIVAAALDANPSGPTPAAGTPQVAAQPTTQPAPAPDTPAAPARLPQPFPVLRPIFTPTEQAWGVYVWDWATNAWTPLASL